MSMRLGEIVESKAGIWIQNVTDDFRVEHEIVVTGHSSVRVPGLGGIAFNRYTYQVDGVEPEDRNRRTLEDAMRAGVRYIYDHQSPVD
jgi:hypothetical protein